MIPLLIALALGTAIAFQAATIGRFTNAAHPLAISLALMLSGLIVGSAWAAVRVAWTDVAHVVAQWWWFPLGVLGWLVVGALGWTVGRLGAALGLALVVGAQLLVALLIDLRSGAIEFGWPSVLGLALLIAGTALLNTGR